VALPRSGLTPSTSAGPQDLWAPGGPACCAGLTLILCSCFSQTACTHSKHMALLPVQSILDRPNARKTPLWWASALSARRRTSCLSHMGPWEMFRVVFFPCFLMFLLKKGPLTSPYAAQRQAAALPNSTASHSAGTELVLSVPFHVPHRPGLSRPAGRKTDRNLIKGLPADPATASKGRAEAPCRCPAIHHPRSPLAQQAKAALYSATTSCTLGTDSFCHRTSWHLHGQLPCQAQLSSPGLSKLCSTSQRLVFCLQLTFSLCYVLRDAFLSPRQHLAQTAIQ